MGVYVEENTPPVELNSTPRNNSNEDCIIVVDDSNIIRNFIQKIFDNKYKVIAISDGEEAISTVDNTPHELIQCIFLDLNMPGVDGFQVLEHFKSNNVFKDIPVSIITGSGDSETVKRAFSYPIIDMIQKPFDEKKIRDVAEKTISRKCN